MAITADLPAQMACREGSSGARDVAAAAPAAPFTTGQADWISDYAQQDSHFYCGNWYP